MRKLRTAVKSVTNFFFIFILKDTYGFFFYRHRKQLFLYSNYILYRPLTIFLTNNALDQEYLGNLKSYRYGHLQCCAGATTVTDGRFPPVDSR